MTSRTRAHIAARIQRVRRILNHPVTLFSGAISLLVTSLHEVIMSAEDFTLGAHHGVLAYSALQLARVFPDLLESLEWAEEASVEVVEVKAEPHTAPSTASVAPRA